MKMNEFFELEMLEFEEKIDAQIVHLSKELSKMRTGAANSSLLDDVLVEYYGVKTPLNQIASVKADAGMITISPFDSSSLDTVTKAIFASNIGITPNNTGDKIILNIPPLTQDSRKEVMKEIDKEKEVAKTHIRTVRNAAKKAIEAHEGKPGVSEDALKEAKEELDKIIAKKNDQIDLLCSKKHEEVKGK
jgi:ribosome recycling factor